MHISLSSIREEVREAEYHKFSHISPDGTP